MYDRTVAVSVLTALILVGCSAWASDGSSPSSTRPAGKETCIEVRLDSGATQLDRRLVPYSPILLGVETTWDDDDRHVLIVSGGYLDDIFEPYDDLEQVGAAEVMGVDAELLATELLNHPVYAAVWRSSETTPCDAKAVIGTGFSEKEFEQLLVRIA